MIVRSLTREIRVRPEVAIARIVEAYDQGGGYPDAAARILGVCRATLHHWNRRLGIVGVLRARSGHRPGWQGGRRYITRLERRPHRSTAWIDARYERIPIERCA